MHRHFAGFFSFFFWPQINFHPREFRCYSATLFGSLIVQHPLSIFLWEVFVEKNYSNFSNSQHYLFSLVISQLWINISETPILLFRFVTIQIHRRSAVNNCHFWLLWNITRESCYVKRTTIVYEMLNKMQKLHVYTVHRELSYSLLLAIKCPVALAKFFTRRRWRSSKLLLLRCYSVPA